MAASTPAPFLMQEDAIKKCTSCGLDKPRADFYASAPNKDGLKPQCKQCYLQKQIEYKFGLSAAAYDALRESQGGACGICARIDRPLHTDHDHSTDQVRGLLCGPCNRAIGVLGDTADGVARAVAYLTQ